MQTTPGSIRANGLHFKVRDLGTGNPALVFLHYWGGTGRTWEPVLEHPSNQYRCVAPDLRGWGGSDRNAIDYNLETQADDVLAIVDSLKLSSYVLVGHSMGGKIAQIVAARRPHGIVALVLVAPAPPSPVVLPQDQRQMMLASYQSPDGMKMALDILVAKPLSAERRQQVIDDSLGGAPAAKTAWIEQGMTLDISKAVGAINVPTVVIAGDADRVESGETLRRELLSRISGAKFLALPGVGHLSPLEAPKELAAAISLAARPSREGGSGTIAGFDA